MSNLNNKTAFVTGSSKGIGAAIAKELATAGGTVILNYSSNKADADMVVAAIRAAGGKAEAIQGDFSKPEDIVRVYDEIKKTHKQLDILVNSAGVYAFGPIDAVTPEEILRQFNLNVMGLLLSTKEALALFGPKGGSIINIGAGVGKMSPANGAIYSGTKGAVNSITVSLSKELGPRKIRVNAVNPGLIKTEGSASGGLLETDFATLAQKSTPLGGIGVPKDIANVALFLASDESSWVSGQEIIVAGGFTM
jgi:3-oxoacyl-[acyl-carrier protein] reductase